MEETVVGADPVRVYVRGPNAHAGHALGEVTVSVRGRTGGEAEFGSIVLSPRHPDASKKANEYSIRCVFTLSSPANGGFFDGARESE